MQRWHLERCHPGFWRGQTRTPRPAAIRAPLVDDRATTVTLRVNDQHRLAVLQENSCGMTEILTRLAIHDHLPALLRTDIHRGDRVTGWKLRLEILGWRQRDILLLRLGRLSPTKAAQQANHRDRRGVCRCHGKSGMG